MLSSISLEETYKSKQIRFTSNLCIPKECKCQNHLHDLNTNRLNKHQHPHELIYHNPPLYRF